jgi:hypothetical protein
MAGFIKSSVDLMNVDRSPDAVIVETLPLLQWTIQLLPMGWKGVECYYTVAAYRERKTFGYFLGGFSRRQRSK